jgi:antitoxin PrlF
MIKSKLSTKSQTTIQQAVRIALDLRDGDELAYTIEDRGVLLRKVAGHQIDDPFATFAEWDSEADRRAYAKF